MLKCLPKVYQKHIKKFKYIDELLVATLKSFLKISEHFTKSSNPLFI